MDILIPGDLVLTHSNIELFNNADLKACSDKNYFL